MNLKTALLLGLSWQLLHMFKRKYFLLMDAYFQLKTIGADNLKPCTFSNHFLNWWLFYLWLRVIIDYRTEEVYLNQSPVFMTNLQLIVVKTTTLKYYKQPPSNIHNTPALCLHSYMLWWNFDSNSFDIRASKLKNILKIASWNKSVNNHKVLHMFRD